MVGAADARVSSGTSTRSAISNYASRRCPLRAPASASAPPRRPATPRSVATTRAAVRTRSLPTPGTATRPGARACWPTSSTWPSSATHPGGHIADYGLPVAHERVPDLADVRHADPRRSARMRPQRRRDDPRADCRSACACNGTFLITPICLNKLKSTPEGAGTVLDNSAIIFMPEAGHGTQLNDSDQRRRRPTRSRRWSCSSAGAREGSSPGGTSRLRAAILRKRW